MAKLIQGVNDLETLFPEIAKQWDIESNGGIMPSQVASRSNRKFTWICAGGSPDITRSITACFSSWV